MASTRSRSTAPERREQIIDAAVRRFAVGGLHGTSTEDIAADTGLSQPYIFRLFGTKQKLFLACADAVHGKMNAVFTEACVGETAEERLQNMGRAYHDLLADEHLLRFQLQTFAAAGDLEIRDSARDGARALLNAVREHAGADEAQMRAFFATGMMLSVATVLRLDEILDAFK